MQSKVSIIVPVYNIEKSFIEKCINSLVKQSLREIEIIIVDDGSDYETAQYIDKISDKDVRINVIHKENGGVSSARNIGIIQASGEYITFLDGDDWLDLECCKISYEIAKKDNADMAAFRYYKEYPKKREEINIFPDGEISYIFDGNSSSSLTDSHNEQVAFNPYDMRIFGFTTMKLYKKALFNNCLFNEVLKNGEDVELNFRLYTRIKSAIYINRAFYHYRQSNESAVRGFNKSAVEEYKATLGQIKKTISENENRNLYKSYLDFTAICYLMIAMNYIFNKNNKISFKKKMKLLKAISNQSPFDLAIKSSKNLGLPFSRKLSLILAKKKLYFGIYMIIEIKLIINRIYG